MNIPVAIEQLDLDPVIYKYRTYSELSVNTFLDSKVYIPSPNEFNDPLDSRMPYRYNQKELTPENIYKKCLLIAKQTYHGLSEEKYQQIAYENQSKNLLFDEEHLEKFDRDVYDNTCRTFGIYSTTPLIDNFLMWSYYSDSHKGFAIGYDTKNLVASNIFGMGGAMLYSNEFPEVPLFPTEEDHHFLSLFLTKWEIWKHENEYRLIHTFKKGKVLEIPKECIAEVVLGVNFPENEKMGFLQRIFNVYPHAKVYQMALLPNTFGLEKKLVFDDNLRMNIRLF